MDNLAVAYLAAGRLADALLLSEETVKACRAKLGPAHPDTLIAISNLALAYKRGGRLADALPLYEDALRLSKATVGPEHPDTLITMHNLAAAYQDAGRWNDAQALFERTLKLRRERLGPEHPATLSSLYRLAQVMKLVGKLAEAEALYRDLVRQCRVFSGHSDLLAKGLAALGAVLVENGHAQEAEAYLGESLEMHRKSLPKGDPTTAENEGLLGNCLRALGRYPEAERLLLSSYEALQAAQGVRPTNLRIAVVRIVNLYEAWNKPGLAAEWRAVQDRLTNTTAKLRDK
jgi:tetratricopeptide (TPR) repeat protein